MARLHRVLKTCDKQDAHVFTFVASLGVEAFKELSSSEFWCGQHKWSIWLTSVDKNIGAFLVMKSASPGVCCRVNYSFTLQNKIHYSYNESFAESDVLFTADDPCHGRKIMIAESDATNEKKGFCTEKREMILELTVSTFRTIFECTVKLPSADCTQASGPMKIETMPFKFGISEWIVVINLKESSRQDRRCGSTLSLLRVPKKDGHCILKYRMHIGAATKAKQQVGLSAQPTTISSAVMTSFYNNAEMHDNLVLPTNVHEMAMSGGGLLSLSVDCIEMTTVAFLKFPIDRNRHRSVSCLDQEGHSWMIEAHTQSDWLTFYVSYDDISKVPKGTAKLVHFGISVVAASGGAKTVPATGSPFKHFYCQKDKDEIGVVARTPIPMKALEDARNQYVCNSTNTLAVRIDWGNSYLLTSPDYSSSDNIPRLHKVQMEKEMQLLQKENLDLEKQVHSYQIAMASRSVTSDGAEQATFHQLVSSVPEEDGCKIYRPQPADQHATKYAPEENWTGATKVRSACPEHVETTPMRSQRIAEPGKESNGEKSDSTCRSSSASQVASDAEHYDVEYSTATREKMKVQASHPKVHRLASDARSDAGYHSDRQMRSEKYTENCRSHQSATLYSDHDVNGNAKYGTRSERPYRTAETTDRYALASTEQTSLRNDYDHVSPSHDEMRYRNERKQRAHSSNAPNEIGNVGDYQPAYGIDHGNARGSRRQPNSYSHERTRSLHDSTSKSRRDYTERDLAD